MRTSPSRASLLAGLAVLALAGLPLSAQLRQPIEVEDLLAMQRVSDPQISPDGMLVAYTVTTPDMESNRNERNIWLISTEGGTPRQLTDTGRDGSARFSPDGTRLAFLSSREGTQQVYVMDLPDGAPRKVTSLTGGADHIVWSPDGRHIAFASQVFPECRDEACNASRSAAREKSPVKARVYDELLYRHWTEWSTGQRWHLFIVPVAGGEARDLTPGADYDVPPVQREGPHPIAFSPDGREIAFVAVTDPVEATSTNGDLFTVAADGSSREPERLTKGAGFDGAPAYSPDGRWLAYRSQERAGYEADRWRLMLYDRQAGSHTEVAPSFDRPVDAIAWAPDSQTIFFNALDRAFLPVFSVPVSGGEPKNLTPETYNGEFALSRDGKRLIVARSSQQSPAELMLLAPDGSGARALTAHNAERLAALDLPPVEHFTFAGAGGTEVAAMLLRPPSFDPARKYPVLMILHGGPQTMFGDTWSYRWNTQVFAAPGYAVLMINRRGSTGFGQKFTDEIRADWGGKAFEDLMLGLDAALAKYQFLDGTRIGAAGASYGGYMIAWMASQARGRFDVLVCHAGVYDLQSMYGATEELWFVEHDLTGPPWTAAETYDRLSPSEHAAEFGKYKTPTLVIHGELDFRVPYTQGLQFYTALQRQGVPSRLIVFPDEGHWILKPQNSAFWYRAVLEWLGKYLGGSAGTAKQSEQQQP